MKKTHILGLIVIAVALSIIISTAGSSSVYATFKEAKAMAKQGSEEKVHVVGQLAKNQSGEILGLHASADKLSCTFLLQDQDGFVQEVYYNEPIPADFTRSEQVVVKGRYHNDVFVAHQILLKCPSKYQENTLENSEATNL